MTENESRSARPWAARRMRDGFVREPESHSEDSVLLTAAMSLLSDYEDAIYSSCRHALVPSGQTQDSEGVHLVEATRLHADVRRLRLEILDLIDASSEVPDDEAG